MLKDVTCADIAGEQRQKPACMRGFKAGKGLHGCRGGCRAFLSMSAREPGSLASFCRGESGLDLATSWQCWHSYQNLATIEAELRPECYRACAHTSAGLPPQILQDTAPLELHQCWRLVCWQSGSAAAPPACLGCLRGTSHGSDKLWVNTCNTSKVFVEADLSQLAADEEPGTAQLPRCEW